jgi:hypothetical protein
VAVSQLTAFLAAVAAILYTYTHCTHSLESSFGVTSGYNTETHEEKKPPRFLTSHPPLAVIRREKGGGGWLVLVDRESARPPYTYTHSTTAIYIILWKRRPYIHMRERARSVVVQRSLSVGTTIWVELPFSSSFAFPPRKENVPQLLSFFLYIICCLFGFTFSTWPFFSSSLSHIDLESLSMHRRPLSTV